MFKFLRKTNENNLKEGENIIYFPGKKRIKSVLNIKNGKREGICKFNHRYGVPVQTEFILNYKDGVKHGIQEQYYSDGRLRQKSNWENGKQVGEVVTYFKNGTIFRISIILNDTITNTKEFFPDGTLRFIKENRKYEFYDHSGNLSLMGFMDVSDYELPKYGTPFNDDFINYVKPFGKWKVFKESILEFELDFSDFYDNVNKRTVEVKSIKDSNTMEMNFEFNSESLAMFDSKFLYKRNSLDDFDDYIFYARPKVMGPPGISDHRVENKYIDIDDLIIFDNQKKTTRIYDPKLFHEMDDLLKEKIGYVYHLVISIRKREIYNRIKNEKHLKELISKKFSSGLLLHDEIIRLKFLKETLEKYIDEFDNKKQNFDGLNEFKRYLSICEKCINHLGNKIIIK